MSGRMPRSIQDWLGGCRDVQVDAGRSVPVEELQHSPVSKPCVGSVLGTHTVKAELAARSACPEPAVCVCCTLAGVAGDHGRWSSPTQQQCPAKLPVILRRCLF